jgi:hypothetical protein
MSGELAETFSELRGLRGATPKIRLFPAQSSHIPLILLPHKYFRRRMVGASGEAGFSIFFKFGQKARIFLA